MNTQYQYSGELWIDEEGNANFKFHILGGNFIDAKEALEKFVECVQERLNNAKKCPYYEQSA